MAPAVNLRRLAECSLCDRLTPVRGNVKQHGDESDDAQLCARCEQTMRGDVAATGRHS